MFIVMTSYHFSNSKRELKCFWKNFSGREGNLQKGLKGHTLCIIAFAYHAAIGDNLRTLIFDQGRMRSHLLSCFERSELTPFPLATTTTDTIRRCALRHHVIILHCTCRMPESGKMIQCEVCYQWYHYVCASIKRAPKRWKCFFVLERQIVLWKLSCVLYAYQYTFPISYLLSKTSMVNLRYRSKITCN